MVYSHLILLAIRSGPSPASVINVSPWSLTVAATTTDRKFVTNVKLGNGELYEVSWIFFFFIYVD